jgi:DNA-directed RNA polymerase subunit N (RpoN/RPB10)
MSRFIAVTCYDCGNHLDDLYECFRAMRAILQDEHGDRNIHVEKLIFDTKPAYGEDIIFEAMGIRKVKECCRTRLLTTVLPHDLETQNSQWNIYIPKT